MDNPELFIGIDPDLHTIPMVFLGDEDLPVTIFQINVDKKLKGTRCIIELAKTLGERCEDMMSGQDKLNIRAVAVENQSMKQAEKIGARKEDILHLGQAAGMMLLIVSTVTDNLYFPGPQQWKGTVPKQIHQARVCNRMGWRYSKAAGYVVPEIEFGTDYVFAGLNAKTLQVEEKVPNKGDWKHIMDSIGLALYAKDVYEGKKKYRP